MEMNKGDFKQLLKDLYEDFKVVIDERDSYKDQFLELEEECSRKDERIEELEDKLNNFEIDY
jgi:hypothetical protein